MYIYYLTDREETLQALLPESISTSFTNNLFPLFVLYSTLRNLLFYSYANESVRKSAFSRLKKIWKPRENCGNRLTNNNTILSPNEKSLAYSVTPRVTMNLQTLFQDFNPSKFLLHSCLMVFTALFALRLDGYIEWSYWTIFSPIWFWKGMVILGATVGSYVWWRHPHARLEGDAYVHYKAMLITLALHLILLMFELLVCDKLESERHLWILVFIPLIFISIMSIAVCIWAVKHDRSFELELFCAVNVLQFIFLALRLDGFITWSWEVVFVPLWALLCLSLVAVLYAIVFAAALLRAPQVNARVRRTSLNSAMAYTFLVVPILVFQVLLANKLDGDISLNYTTVAAPLLLSHMTLIFMSFGAKGGNRWWFGIRKDFSHFLLSLCPLLQEYGNISYQPRSDQDQPPTEPMVSEKNEKRIKKMDLTKPVVPIISIEMPD